MKAKKPSYSAQQKKRDREAVEEDVSGTRYANYFVVSHEQTTDIFLLTLSVLNAGGAPNGSIRFSIHRKVLEGMEQAIHRQLEKTR